MSSIRGPMHNTSQTLPTTATVLDFICLFTHDLKRKQKRWQDGRLKFHTFNNRVMVYDDRGNFIGDTHWREDFELGEGEEVTLDRGGVLVQVSDCVGRKEQDLSELVDKRVKEMEMRHMRIAASPVTTPTVPAHRVALQLHQTHQINSRHRPLHELINIPEGHHGRAIVSKTSPYEDRRHQTNGPDDHAPPPKRRKREISPPSKSGYAQSLFGATLTLSSWSASPQPTYPDRRDEARRNTACETASSRLGVVRSVDDDQAPPSSGRSQSNGDSGTRIRRPPSPVVDKDIEVVAKADWLGTVEHTKKLTKKLPQTPIERPVDRNSRPNGRYRQASPDERLVSINQPAPPILGIHAGKSPPMEDLRGPVIIERAISSISQRNNAKTNSEPPSLPRNVSKLGEVRTIRDKNPKTAALDTATRAPRISDAGVTRASHTRPAINKDLDTEHTFMPVDEPKTELRIRSKPKRGLLMVSEKKQTKKNTASRHEQSTTEQQPPMIHNSLREKEPESNPSVINTRLEKGTHASSDRSIEAGLALQKPVTNALPTGIGRKKKEPLPAARKPQADGRDYLRNALINLTTSGADVQPEHLAGTNTGSTTSVVTGETGLGQVVKQHASHSRSTSSSEVTKDGCDSSRPQCHQHLEGLDANPQVKSGSKHGSDHSGRQLGPRLASFGRRGVKSKEIIGYPIYETDHRSTRPPCAVPDPQCETTVHQEPTNHNPPLDEVGSEVQKQVPESHQPAPLANPATRGKKAAKISDAAGQVPQPIVAATLTFESLGEIGRQGNLVGRTGETDEVPGEAPIQSITKLPGFSRANGGPWSREAHDLLGSKRPS